MGDQSVRAIIFVAGNEQLFSYSIVNGRNGRLTALIGWPRGSTALLVDLAVMQEAVLNVQGVLIDECIVIESV